MLYPMTNFKKLSRRKQKKISNSKETEMKTHIYSQMERVERTFICIYWERVVTMRGNLKEKSPQNLIRTRKWKQKPRKKLEKGCLHSKIQLSWNINWLFFAATLKQLKKELCFGMYFYLFLTVMNLSEWVALLFQNWLIII